NRFSLRQIAYMVRYEATLDAEITQLEDQLSDPHVSYYLQQARDLGLFMVTSKVVSDNLAKNAHNIAFLGRTDKTLRDPDGQAHAARMQAILDPLISLYAIKYSKPQHREITAEIMAEERARRDGGNGIDLVLRFQRQLEKQSKADLFDDNDVLMMKGYTKE